MEIIKNFIHGKKETSSNNYLSVIDPSTGEEISKVVLSDEEDFKNVIASSKKGYNEWSQYTPLKRSRILSKYKNLKYKETNTNGVWSRSTEKHEDEVIGPKAVCI